MGLDMDLVLKVLAEFQRGKFVNYHIKDEIKPFDIPKNSGFHDKILVVKKNYEVTYPEEIRAFDPKPKSLSAKLGFSLAEPEKDAKKILGLVPQDNLDRLAQALYEFNRGVSYDAENILSRFKKESTLEKDLKNYSVERELGLGISRKFQDRFYDAPYSFILCYNVDIELDRPIAGISFSRGTFPLASISFDCVDNAILVRQIQGVKGRKAGLDPIKWQRALLEIVCDWARENNVPEVRVIPHTKSIWKKVRDNGYVLYDVTAKRSGFVYDQKMEVYRKTLEK